MKLNYTKDKLERFASANYGPAGDHNPRLLAEDCLMLHAEVERLEAKLIDDAIMQAEEEFNRE